MAVIELQKLTKTYGSSRGVTELELAVEQGTVFGFLGPNGAGKTTTISMLVDLIRPSSGAIKIFGLDSVKDSREIRRRIGFLAGDFALDESLTGLQQLQYFANLHSGVSLQRIHELAERFDCNLTHPIGNLSRGNRQKVGLISALMHDPELLILDEPTSGLDPLVQAEFNKVILEHKQRGRTTFMSSHTLSEVQEICDKVGFIKDGKLLAVQQLQQLQAGAPKHLVIKSTDKTLLAQLKKLAGVQGAVHQGYAIRASFTGDVSKLVTLLSRFELEDLVIQDADLETIFMQYYGGTHV